jgi:AraC-like DNA-binding protein
MTVNTTAGAPIIERPGRSLRGSRVSGIPGARPSSPARGPQERLFVIQGRAGAARVIALDGTVDLAGASVLGEVLAYAARTRDPLVLDLSRAAVHGDADRALLVHFVRWVCRRHPHLTIVCVPGPTRAALERSEICTSAEIVADHRALTAPSSGLLSRRDALVTPVGRVRRPRAGTSARRARLLAEAALAIEDRHAEPELALGDIARQIATSERQLQRIFAELAASAFRDELAAVRMQHAARLLHDSHMTVGEITRHVGYRQASQFSKAFRRCYGATPTAFVRRLA